MLRFSAHRALDDHHGAAAPIGDAVTTRAAPEEPEDRADGHAADRAAQVMIPRQQRRSSCHCARPVNPARIAPGRRRACGG
jgi:hypothetical protein